jgi:hypothetical protein
VDTTQIIIAAAAAAAAIAIAVVAFVLVRRSRERGRLRDEFGSEYDRTVGKSNGRGRAEAELRERERRVDGYDLHPLPVDQARIFRERWREAQSEFVDEPGEAVEHADALLVEVLEARGYASSTTRERIEDLSVGHGDEAEDYRLARATALRNRSGSASTEELRQAMLHFERVFKAMLVAEAAKPAA